MSMEVLTKLDQLRPLRAAWNRLAGDNPFLCLEWIESWWEAYGEGNRLFVVVARDEQGEPIGIAPWYRTSHVWGGTLRFIGSLYTCCDYLRVLVAPGRGRDFYARLAEFLTTREARSQGGSFQRLALDGIDASDEGMRQLGATMTQAGYRLRNEPIDSCWRIDLPASWDELLRGLSTSRRSRARRVARRLDSGEIATHSSHQLQRWEWLNEVFADLHQRRRQQLGQAGCFADERFARFIREASRRLCQLGRARFEWCEWRGEPIAIQFQLLNPDIVLVYLTGMDPQRRDLEPGHTMVAGSLRSAMAGGYQAYDLLRGDEQYKSFWGAQPLPLRQMVLTAPNASARMVDAVQGVVTWTKQLAKSALLGGATTGIHQQAD